LGHRSVAVRSVGLSLRRGNQGFDGELEGVGGDEGVCGEVWGKAMLAWVLLVGVCLVEGGWLTWVLQVVWLHSFWGVV
jgi:hypothetical protein